MEKMASDGPKWGQEDFFSANPDLANILGRTDLDFENFWFFHFFWIFDLVVYRFVLWQMWFPLLQTGWIGTIGPVRKIDRKMVIFLSHGRLFGTPQPIFFRSHGLFFGTPRPIFFKNHGLFFGTPRQFFSRVMGYFFGPLGQFFQESWTSFLGPLGQFFSRIMGFFFGPLGQFFQESWTSFLDP